MPVKEKAKQKTYSVFKVKNENPKGKNKDKIFYHVTKRFDNEEGVKTVVRAMLKSKTIRGGAKSIAGDMAKDSDYKDDFSVTKIASGLSKEAAYDLRDRLKHKAKKKYLYNKEKGPNQKRD
jgi:hypothetical protein